MAFPEPPAESAQPKRPFRVSLLSILLWIVEGAIALSCLWGAGSITLQLIAGPGVFASSHGNPALQAVLDRYLPRIVAASLHGPQLGLDALQVVLSGLVIAAAAGLFLRDERARGRLRQLLIAAMVAALAWQVFIGVVQYRLYPVMVEYMKAVAEASTHGRHAPAGMGKIMSAATLGGIILGMLLQLLVSLAKLGLYVFGFVYCGTGEAKRFTGGESPLPKEP